MTGRGLGKYKRSPKHLVPGNAAVHAELWTCQKDTEPAGVASHWPRLEQLESNIITAE